MFKNNNSGFVYGHESTNIYRRGEQFHRMHRRDQKNKSRASVVRKNTYKYFSDIATCDDV